MAHGNWKSVSVPTKTHERMKNAVELHDNIISIAELLRNAISDYLIKIESRS